MMHSLKAMSSVETNRVQLTMEYYAYYYTTYTICVGIVLHGLTYNTDETHKQTLVELVRLICRLNIKQETEYLQLDCSLFSCVADNQTCIH